MSERITVEMISDETSEACRDAHFEAIRKSATIGGNPEAEIAAILNAAMADPVIRAAFVAEAIERGEASPPCYAFRYDDIKLLAVGDEYDNGKLSPAVFITPNEAVERFHGNKTEGKAEHWKGQTNTP